MAMPFGQASRLPESQRRLVFAKARDFVKSQDCVDVGGGSAARSGLARAGKKAYEMRAPLNNLTCIMRRFDRYAVNATTFA